MEFFIFIFFACVHGTGGGGCAMAQRHKGTMARPSLTSHESRLAFLLAVVETRQLRHALHSASHSHKPRRLIVLYRTSAPANMRIHDATGCTTGGPKRFEYYMYLYFTKSW